MSKKHAVKKLGRDYYIDIPNVGVFAYSGDVVTSENFSDLVGASSEVNWESDSELVRGMEIVPFGVNNNLPAEIRKIMDENNLAPGILEREIGLLHGQGFRLYSESLDVENNKFVRKWQEDNEIQAWLDSFNYMRYLDMCIVEYKYMKGFFTKYYRNRGARIGKEAKIAELRCIPGTDARLGWVNSRRLEDVSVIYTGDFENDCQDGINSYPVFDKKQPFRSPVSMSYNNNYSFARNFYSVPSFYGALNWIKRSSDVPIILKNLTDNGIYPSYEIKSPAMYWEQKKTQLEEKCILAGKQYTDSMLDDLKEQTLDKIGQVLAGKKNVGKFFHSISFYDEQGNKHDWEVKAIEKDIKNFISAQLEISSKADAATTSGIGLHPSLSNIMVAGKLASGSEMLYALKLYILSDTAIPERIITDPINTAIKINFPNSNLKLGLYREVVLTEEATKPEDRVKNN